MSGIPLINGVRPAWANVRINILGRTITGIVSIDRGIKRKKENQYGAGDEPDHRGYGNKEYECSLTLYKYEVDAIQSLLQPGQDLTDIAPFDIPLQWLDTGQTVISKETWKDFEFTEEKLSTKQGDTKTEIVLPGIISKVLKNV
ncbi:MAG: hypothetical protein AB7P01_06090 [Bacteroidia bacterium]